MSEYTFSKIELHDNRFIKPLVYGWCLVIHNWVELLEYENTIYKSKLEKEFSKASQALAGHTHYNQVGFTVELIAENNNESLVGAFGILTERFMKGANEALNYGCLYFQRCGSYFLHNKYVKIVETKQTKELSWPIDEILTLKDINIAQWPEGKHWYITTKEGITIKDGDMEKFNTYEYAEGVAKRYIESYNKK
jgi:hypothetical protein